MSKETTAVAKSDEKLMEYVPFGAKEKIKLSVSIVKNLICVPTKSGKRCSDQDAVKFLMLCQARALNPFEGDCFLIGYDGREGPTYSLITAHQAFLKRAELNSEYNGMESGVVIRNEDEDTIDKPGDFLDEGDELVGGWAKVHFKTRSIPMYKRIRLSTFKKSFGIWLDNPAGMIVKCAEADALRSSFPTMMGGLYLKEEVEGKASTMSSVTPVFNTPEQSGVVVDVQSAPEPTPMDKIRELCSTSGVSEDALMKRLIELGHVPEGGTISDLEENPDMINHVIDNWTGITKRKEANGKKG